MNDSAPRFIDPSRQHRAAHRARMHAEAHSQEEEKSGPILEHPLVTPDKPQLIENDSQLSSLLEHLREAGSFAYDSEFIGELTYVPKLCLIQVATTQVVALVDPLAEVDLMPFWELVCDRNVQKIVHAGEQDVEPVVRITGRGPKNLIDTQVLAAFCGLAYPASLQKLVSATLQFKLSKGLTFTHWDQRPLSAMQLRYAADDVRYLPAMAEELSKRARSAGNLEIAQEECSEGCEAANFQSDPAELFLKIRGSSNMSRTQLSVLRELCMWRDATARAEDIPTRALLRDEVLVGLVRTTLQQERDVENVRGMPRPVAKRFWEEIISVVRKGHEIPAMERPFIANHEEGPVERFEIEALWSRFQCACFDRKIDPAVAASRQGVAEFYRQRESGGDASNHPLMMGWRGEIMRTLNSGRTPPGAGG